MSPLAAWPLVVVAVALLVVWLVGPLLFMVSARQARKLGIDLGSPASVTAAARLDTLVVDGLAPLLDGMEVTETRPVEEDHRANLRWFAGALARHGSHPAYAAIARLAPRGRVTDPVETPENGLSGSVDRHPVRISAPVPLGDPTVAQVTVTVDDRVLGTLDLTDRVTEETREALSVLASHEIGVVLASATETARACAVAERLGIRHEDADAGDLRLKHDGAGVLERVSDALHLRLDPPASTIRARSFDCAVSAITYSRRLRALTRTVRIAVACCAVLGVVVAVVALSV